MKTWLLNTLDIGLDLLDFLRQEIPVQGVIGLTERAPGDAISDYLHMEAPCAARGLSFVPVEDYSLQSPADRQRLSGLEIDVLVVSGWQRLLPPWLLDQATLCAIGAHGSPFGITQGRGRSPQNWALIMGAREFSISIQRLEAGVDSGDVIDTMTFSYDQLDDIRSSYYKVSWCVAQMLTKGLRDGAIADGRFTPQEHEGAHYLPQRLPEDGAIDWCRSSGEVHDFIRALTRPYPGAFCDLGNGARLKVWRATPLSLPEFPGATPGKIVRIYPCGDLLVATGSGCLLVRDYEVSGPHALAEGQQLPSVDFRRQMAAIITRHRARFPEQPIAPGILRLMED